MSSLLFFSVFLQFVMIETNSPINNWALLVATSRYWFNYRHIANTLSIYHTIKALGIPDSNIILMISEDIACDSRNPFPACVFNSPSHSINLYDSDIEVDYRGREVTVENFLRVLTNRLPDTVPRSKRLLTNSNSNILIYLTGHGGNEFLKFQDSEQISSYDIADGIRQAYKQNRYREILLIVDTCQAGTLFNDITSPNVLAIGSSAIDESSLFE